MSHHLYDKLNRFFHSENAFSIIEVVIVMAITGFTLIALLNLAVRDLLIEKYNEQSDVSNFISVGQIESFDNISSSPGCLAKLASNFTNSGITSYFICHASSFNGLTSVNECNQTVNANWYLFYENPSTTANFQNLAYANGVYDCTTAAPAAGAASYSGKLTVLNYDSTNHFLELSSDVERLNSVFINNPTNPPITSVQQEYFF